jgi:hypothetical protein
MYTNRSSHSLQLGRFVSLMLVLILALSASLAGHAAPPEPAGAIAGTISLPPEALQAQVHLSTQKTALDGKQDSAIKALAEAARVSTQDALQLADAAGLRRSGELIHIQAATTPGRLENARQVIEQAGGQVTGVAWDNTLLQAWLPLQALETVAANPQVDYLRLPEQVSIFEQNAGGATTEGLSPMNAPAWHSAGFQGAGVKVAIIDAGFLGYTSLLGSDLPGSVTVANFVDADPDPLDGTTEHGTANAEIVYDIAPQASLYLAKIATNIDLQEAVAWAKSNGVDVISTSVGWYNLTPGDGTGEFANIVQDARNNGIIWATAAGNNREAHWGGAFNDPDGDDYHQFNGTQEINYFGPGNGDAYLINPGFDFSVFLRWDDWTNVNQDYDLILVRWDGSSWVMVASSANDQNGGAGQTPTEDAAYTTSGDPAPYGFVIARYDSSRNVNLEAFAPNFAPLDERVNARSLSNLADAPDVVTVAALDVVSPYPQESYSSEGPTNGPGGTEAGGSIKPDLSGYANVSTISYGAGAFSGTSPATPHVAGAAVLVQNAYPAYTPTQIESFLTSRAVDMGTAGLDNAFGYGRLYLGAPPVANTAPTISGLPDQFVPQNSSKNNAIDLWAYANDNETSDSGLIFTINNSPNASAGVTLDSNRYVDITPAAAWTGQTDVEIKVADPGGLFSTDTFKVTVDVTGPSKVFLPILRRFPPPAAPTNLVAAATSSSTIHLTWNENASDETGYKLERSPDGSAWSPLITLPANTNSHDDTGLQPNTPYYYRLKAINGARSSAYSNTASAVTQSSGPSLCNGDFEQGSGVCWTEYSTHGWSIIVSSGFPGGLTPRSGSWAAWLGGDDDDLSYVEQQVAVTAGSPYLAYYHWIASSDACGYDYGGVLVNGSTVDAYDLCSSQNTGGWVQHVVNLSAYIGQTVTLQIRAETDASGNSNLFIDDVAFQSGPTASGSATPLQVDPAQALPRLSRPR